MCSSDLEEAAAVAEPPEPAAEAFPVAGAPPEASVAPAEFEAAVEDSTRAIPAYSDQSPLRQSE